MKKLIPILILAVACNSNKSKVVLRMPEIHDTSRVSVIIPGDVSQEPYMVSKGRFDSDMQAIKDTLENHGIRVYSPGHDPHMDSFILHRLPEIIYVHPKAVIIPGRIEKDGESHPNAEGKKIINEAVETYYDTTDWHPLLSVCDTCAFPYPNEGDIWEATDGHYYTIRNGKKIETIPQEDQLHGFFTDDTAYYHRLTDSILSKKP